jgi:hypothetical protein
MVGRFIQQSYSLTLKEDLVMAQGKMKIKKAEYFKILESANRVSVVLEYFKLLKSWDDDDEEDLDVMILANGQELYGTHNLNHDVGVEYGKGKTVNLVGVSVIEASGAVKCADYHEPFYGSDKKAHSEPFPTDTQQIGAEQNGGKWEAKYRIVVGK